MNIGVACKGGVCSLRKSNKIKKYIKIYVGGISTGQYVKTAIKEVLEFNGDAVIHSI